MVKIYNFAKGLPTEPSVPFWRHYFSFFNIQDKFSKIQECNQSDGMDETTDKAPLLKTQLAGNFFWYTKILTMLNLYLIVGRILYWWARWFAPPKSGREFNSPELWQWKVSYSGRKSPRLRILEVKQQILYMRLFQVH